MRLRLPFMFLIPAALVFCQPTNAPAQQTPSFACQRIKQDYITKQNRIQSREISFFLFEAAAEGCNDLIESFLDAGAMLNARDRKGNTAFLLAAKAGERKTLKLLMERGAKIQQRNLQGSNAVLLAAKANRSASVKLLLKAGVAGDVADRRGVTPLMAAAFNANSKIVRLLLAEGVAKDPVDATGKTALIYAAARGFTPVVQLLLDAGAEVNQRGGHDLTALMWAAGHSNDVPASDALATLDLLVERGAALDLTNDLGQSALITAARRGHYALYERLLQLGADPKLKDRKGKRAADWLKALKSSQASQ